MMAVCRRKTSESFSDPRMNKIANPFPSRLSKRLYHFGKCKGSARVSSIYSGDAKITSRESFYATVIALRCSSVGKWLKRIFGQALVPNIFYQLHGTA